MRIKIFVVLILCLICCSLHAERLYPGDPRNQGSEVKDSETKVEEHSSEVKTEDKKDSENKTDNKTETKDEVKKDNSNIDANPFEESEKKERKFITKDQLKLYTSIYDAFLNVEIYYSREVRSPAIVKGLKLLAPLEDFKAVYTLPKAPKKNVPDLEKKKAFLVVMKEKFKLDYPERMVSDPDFSFDDMWTCATAMVYEQDLIKIGCNNYTYVWANTDPEKARLLIEKWIVQTLKNELKNRYSMKVYLDCEKVKTITGIESFYNKAVLIKAYADLTEFDFNTLWERHRYDEMSDLRNLWMDYAEPYLSEPLE